FSHGYEKRRRPVERKADNKPATGRWFDPSVAAVVDNSLAGDRESQSQIHPAPGDIQHNLNAVVCCVSQCLHPMPPQ
ncbi:MAG TPA: hypothetical protein VG168_08505, partial [Bryobacteraceae bacterium]|nr:hypothetical protein [Bryobacteraceae bacterium]